MIRASLMGGAAVAKEAIAQFFAERAPRMAAALAFYTTFSLAPLLIFAVVIAGLVFGEDAAEGKIVGELQGVVGKAGASTIEDLIENARQPASSSVAAILAAVTLLFGATGVVVELQDSMNTIWNVHVRQAGISHLVRKRLVSFAMVLGIGFLLLVSLILSAVMTALTTLAGSWLSAPEALLHFGDLALSFLGVGLLFALIYRIVPDTHVRWRDVWWGAGIASVLFAIGKAALGYYIANSTFTSTYGAAGSLVALLLWVYYSAQILFLGAEIAQVGSKRKPHDAALPRVLRHRPRTSRRA